MPSANAHHTRPVVGVLLKLASVVLLSCLAACVKYLGDGVPTGQIIFVRGVISAAVLGGIAWRFEGLHILRSERLKSHALRSLAGTASMFCWFTALTLIPLADFTAISFTAPMFLTVLAMLFLGERIHAYRWTALVEILRTKKREMPIAEGPVQPSSQNAINLMDALRRSMESERPAVAKPPPRRAASKPAKRSSSARGQTAT